MSGCNHDCNQGRECVCEAPQKVPARLLPIPKEPYDGKELRPNTTRPGSGDALRLLSRGLKC